MVLRPSKKNRSEKDTRNCAILVEMLVKERSISHLVADSFAKKHAFLSEGQALAFVEDLAQRLRVIHLSRHGYPIQSTVLARSIELCLERLSRSRKGLSSKQLSHFLQFARNQIASEIILRVDPHSPGERENVLKPLLEVIVYEDDPMTRDRLMFIFRLFVDNGLRLPKDKVLVACSSDKSLFPTKRAVEDTLDTLRGSYEALRLLNGEFFVAPEYLAGGQYK
ncbi:MAG: hypothetical protein ABIH23_16495 [bacterium]